MGAHQFHLAVKMAQLFQLCNRKAIISFNTIRPGLLDPIMDHCRAGLIFPRKTLNTAISSRQRNQLFTKSRGVRVPRSRHEKQPPSSAKKCASNRGNSRTQEA